MVVLLQGRKQIVADRVAQGHLGVSCMKSLAWMFVWWPKPDESLESGSMALL